MPIQQGENLPDVTLSALVDGVPTPVKITEFCQGKRVVLVAVPGAFSPSCSRNHLPGYVKDAAAIKAKGVDSIVCLSVNDAFVMDAWGKEHNVGDDITMLADGNGHFTRAVDMTMDASGFGMGTRSLRYALVVDDGKVSKVLVEANPSSVDVSSAQSVLQNL